MFVSWRLMELSFFVSLSPLKHACACGGLLTLYVCVCVCVQADLFHACLAQRGVVEFDVSHYGVSHHSQLRAASSYPCVCAAPQKHFFSCHDVARQSDLSAANKLDGSLVTGRGGLKKLLLGTLLSFHLFFFFLFFWTPQLWWRPARKCSLYNRKLVSLPSCFIFSEERRCLLSVGTWLFVHQSALKSSGKENCVDSFLFKP